MTAYSIFHRQAMSDLVERLHERAESYRQGGPSSEHTAVMLDEAASRISQQDAELERLRREVEEARGAIAWANNSLFGSHGFFLSLDGGEPDEHHLDRAIEDMKARNRAHFAQLSEARKGAFVEAAEMFDQNRSWGGRDVAAALRAKAEETGHE